MNKISLPKINDRFSNTEASSRTTAVIGVVATTVLTAIAARYAYNNVKAIFTSPEQQPVQQPLQVEVEELKEKQ